MSDSLPDAEVMIADLNAYRLVELEDKFIGHEEWLEDLLEDFDKRIRKFPYDVLLQWYTEKYSI